MNLLEIVHRPPTAVPWSEGDNIPWNEPGFSARMLQEHLSQAHDWASRRVGIIDQTVAWIHHQVLHQTPTRILDLGCGPGLYTYRLARLGHDCVGVDFGPASIQYARAQAAEAGLPCTYLEQDVRTADVGSGYGLVMCIFGEFNVFSPAHADVILEKAHQALAPGGHLLLEAHTFDAVRKMGGQPPTWTSAESGLFSDGPHIVMQEHLWDAQASAATIRYYIVDGLTAEVARHAQSLQAYTEGQYRSLLARHGFGPVEFSPSWGGEGSGDLVVIVAGP